MQIFYLVFKYCLLYPSIINILMYICRFDLLKKKLWYDQDVSICYYLDSNKNKNTFDIMFLGFTFVIGVYMYILFSTLVTQDKSEHIYTS